MGSSWLLLSEFGNESMSIAEGYHENYCIKSVKSLKEPQEKHNHTQSPLTTGMGHLMRSLAKCGRQIAGKLQISTNV